MPLISWAVLITLAFIFIFVGVALVVYFTFFFSEETNFGLGALLCLLAAIAGTVVLPGYASTAIIPALIIAASFFVAVLAAAANFLLPYFDNKEAAKAFRPLIIFTIVSGVMVAAANIAKAFVA